jgi:hypothetical protein
MVQNRIPRVCFHGVEFLAFFSSAEWFGTEFRDFSVPWNSRNSAGTNQFLRLFRLPRNNFLLETANPTSGPSPTSSPVSKLHLFLSLPVCRQSTLRTGEGGRRWARSRIIRPQESLALYKSFNSYFLYTCILYIPLWPGLLSDLCHKPEQRIWRFPVSVYYLYFL